MKKTKKTKTAYTDCVQTAYEKKKIGTGILYILGAALSFALMNLFVRLAGDLPVMQKVFFRNLVATFAVLPVFAVSREKFRIRRGSLPYLLLRSAIGFLGIVLNFYAIDRLNISDASILNKLSPFFAILFSALLLRERPRLAELFFVLLAFSGALLVIKPTFTVESLPALSGFASGLCAGFAYTCVRALGMRGERGTVTVFFFSAFSTLVSLPFLLAFYRQMSAEQWCFLLLSGCAAAGGQFFITAAYRFAPAKDIAVFDYAQVLFAALLGYLFLEQLPDAYSFAGYAIILAAAIGKWVWVHVRSKHAPASDAQTSENKTNG